MQLSRLSSSFSLLSASLCGNFVMHFIYSQRQILIYRGDMAYAAFRVRQSHRTLAATLPSTAERERKGETEGRKERKDGRLARRSEILKRNTTIPLMEFL